MRKVLLYALRFVTQDSNLVTNDTSLEHVCITFNVLLDVTACTKMIRNKPCLRERTTFLLLLFPKSSDNFRNPRRGQLLRFYLVSQLVALVMNTGV